MYCIASLSHGKDSQAQLYELVERGYLLHEAVFYDTGMEFQAIYDISKQTALWCKEKGIKYTILRPDSPFEYAMYDKPVCAEENRKCSNCMFLNGCTKKAKKRCVKFEAVEYSHTGYSWCGGTCRWGTTAKLEKLDKYAKERNAIVYVGIAADETERLKKEAKPYKRFPLAEWGLSEKQCLDICYRNGIFWQEGGG